MLTVKVVGDISKHYVPMPRLLPNQSTIASTQEKYPYILSHQGLKAFQLSSESPMMIYGKNIPILDVPFLHFTLLDQPNECRDWVKLSDPKQALQNESFHFDILSSLFPPTKPPDDDEIEPNSRMLTVKVHLDTISETESDEFIKSSVENLVPSPSKSRDECECDVPVCNDFTTFYNLLFDDDDDLSSSDNESFSDKDIPKEIYSNPLFDEEIISIKIHPHHFNAESDLIESFLNHDSSIIYSSSKIDSLHDEFTGELILLK
nr:hypothetical protein [Tanacetum cinerariifolium]